MSKKKQTNESVAELDEDDAELHSYDDPNYVPIKLNRASPTEDLVLHSRTSDTVYRRLDALEGEWKRISDKILKIVGSASESTLGSLDSVTFSLGFNAKGKVVFVAEAGAETSISVTFKPNRKAEAKVDASKRAKDERD